MLKKIYDKSEIWFAVLWIIAYCVALSMADSLSSYVGVEKSVTFPVGLLLSLVLFAFLGRNGLLPLYGLRLPSVKAGTMLYYLPLILMISTNLWYGVTLNYGFVESALYVLSMLLVGFLEEVIFRGLLFNAMRKSGMISAVAVSSITFGIGHIINLINGSGAELLSNILQVVYATAAGFMFVMIYLKSDSLVFCILAHGVFNALSVFADESAVTPTVRVIFALALTLITSAYGVYLAFKIDWGRGARDATR